MNVSMLINSFKYINSNLTLIVKLSLWINNHLTESNTNDRKLHKAFKNKDDDIIYELMPFVSNVSQFNEYFDKYFYRENNIKMLTLFVNHGMSVEAYTLEDFIAKEKYNEITKILCNKRTGDFTYQVVKTATEFNVEIALFLFDSCKHIPKAYILDICLFAQVRLLELVLRKGYTIKIDIDYLIRYYKQSIFDYPYKPYCEMLRILLTHGYGVNNLNDFLYFGLKQSNESFINMILEKSDTINFDDIRGSFKTTIYRGEFHIIKKILSKATVTSDVQNNILLAAIKYGNLDIISELTNCNLTETNIIMKSIRYSRLKFIKKYLTDYSCIQKYIKFAEKYHRSKIVKYFNKFTS